MPRRELVLAMLLLAALPAGCGKPPEPFREFPDIPAYPGATLQKKEPADPEKPATFCLYRVRDIKWVSVHKFYQRWMPKFGWTPEEKPTHDPDDPHIYFSLGKNMCAIDPRSYAEHEQFGVFVYPKDQGKPQDGGSADSGSP